MATIELRDLNPAEFNNNLIVYGNVGVGTAPSYDLHVKPTAGNADFVLEKASAVSILVQANSTIGKIGTQTNNDVQFITNNSTKMTLGNGGNVGIGTTSPTANLHIVDSSDPVLKIQNTSANPANGGTIHFIESGGTDGFKIHHDGNENRLEFQFESSSSETTFMTLKRDTGNVGIGTSSPGRLLEVSDDTNGTVDLFRLRNADTTYSQLVDFSLDTNKDLVIAGSSSNGGLHFNMGARGYTFSNGNVGIGMTPGSTYGLYVSGKPVKFISDGAASNGAVLELVHANNDSTDVVSTLTFANNVGAVAHIQGGTTGGNTNGYISFLTDNAGTSSEKMRILADGKLGIGTDSPTARLHVDNTAGGDDIKFETSTDHDLNLVLEAGTANNQFSLRIPDEIDRLEFMSDSNIRMTLLDNGNVGINETSPTEKLHVDGNLKVTGDVLIGSTATSITEVGPYDPYVLYHWTGRQYQNGGSSDIMYFNGDALYYADADSPWNKSSVAAANPESLTTLVGGATFNRTYQTRNWEWHYMIRLDNTTKTDSALPTKYMRIKMPVYYTAGASEHHVFYFQVLNNDDYQSGFQLCVCDSSGNPVKRAAVQHKNGGGWATYGSYQRGPNNSVANQSTGKYGEWTNSLIMGGHIDSYSFADSDSPTGRSIYLSINCSTANSNNYIWFMGFAIGKNKKGIAITTPRIIVNGANDPARGKVNLYGNGLRHHNNWHWSEMAFVHQQHASTTPIQIAGTDKDIIINFMNTGHSDHEFDKVTLFLTDKDSNQRYDGSGGGNFGWDSHVPNQWVNAGLMNIGSFTGNGADKWLGYSHRGGISLSWIIKKQLLQELAYDVDGITNLRVGFGNVNNHWRHGYIRGIATEQINS